MNYSYFMCAYFCCSRQKSVIFIEIPTHRFVVLNTYLQCNNRCLLSPVLILSEKGKNVRVVYLQSLFTHLSFRER